MLSLAMIVRDNENILDDCLRSIRPWVDEMVVVDTGSVDSTPEIARGHGAQVFHFPWCDDFSAARNESIRHAKGDWIFWMDSDDTMSEDCGRRLQELAHGPHDPVTLGYTAQVRCPGGESGRKKEYTVVDHVKLFRNHPDIRFEFRIHEQLLPSIRRLGGTVAWTDIYVTHSGSDPSPEGRRRKCERDLRILAKELEDRPDHPFALFNFGMTYADMQRHNEAVESLQSCLRHSKPDESHVRKAYALLAGSLAALGRTSDAARTCEAALNIFPDDPELHFRLGGAMQQLGELNGAVEEYRLAMKPLRTREFSSIDPGITAHKAWHNMGIACREGGDGARAELYLREALRITPEFSPSQIALLDLLLEQQRLASAEIELAELEQGPARAAREARLAILAGQRSRAASILEAAAAQQSEHEDLRHAWLQFLFEFGDPRDTIRVFEDVAEREPENGSIRHNLGVLHARLGDLRSACAWLKESLRVRPNSPQTKAELARIHQALADDTEENSQAH